MDQQRFDEITRQLANRSSRRSIVKRFVAGLVAGASGAGGAQIASAGPSNKPAQKPKPCKRTGKKCKKDSQCCTDQVCGNDRVCSAGCRIGGQTYAPGPHPSDPCLTCDPDISTSSWTVTVGAVCGVGDVCMGEQVCQSDGSCAGTPSAPTVYCPENQAVYTDSGMCGAIVSFTASAECGEVTCSHWGGDTFEVGVTTVTCSADNASGHTECSFTVEVSDNEHPTITCPADIFVPAAGEDGAIVDFAVSAADNCLSTAISCAPPSGSTFPIGTTLVDCTAIDLSSYETTCLFTVTVGCEPNCAGKSCGDYDGCGGFCDGPCYSAGVCQTATCDTSQGVCVTSDLPEGSDCQDACNVGATCNGFGSCTGGFPLECTQDFNPCLAATGYCDPAAGCVFDQLPEGTICAELNDLCTPSVCNASGGCEQIVTTCSDEECQFCDPTLGYCVNRDDDTSCGGGSGACLGGFCNPI
jgi:hypothetical protein